jgi:ankyrin repeat protein
MEDGLSGLMYAHYRGQGEVVAALRSGGRRMYMTEAAALGDLERVQRIANAWKESINHYSNDGYTPLQLACFFGHPAVAAFLLQNGADPGVVSKNVMRIQPIHAAVASRQAEIVQMLIEAGADVNAKQQDDFTPLMAALQNGDAKIAALLRQAGALD